jgi:hypothetical protein
MSDANAQVITFTPGMRTLICDAIEAMILLLDEIDGDPELEKDVDCESEPDLEPSLGATHGMDQRHTWQATIADTDAEHEHDGREPDADFEPNEVYAFRRNDTPRLSKPPSSARGPRYRRDSSRVVSAADEKGT